MEYLYVSIPRYFEVEAEGIDCFVEVVRHSVSFFWLSTIAKVNESRNLAFIPLLRVYFSRIVHWDTGRNEPGEPTQK